MVGMAERTAQDGVDGTEYTRGRMVRMAQLTAQDGGDCTEAFRGC